MVDEVLGVRGIGKKFLQFGDESISHSKVEWSKVSKKWLVNQILNKARKTLSIQKK